MSLLIERAHALREAALAAASAVQTVTAEVPATASKSVAEASGSCEATPALGGPVPIPAAVLPPSFGQQKVAQKAVVAPPTTAARPNAAGPSVAKQEGVVAPAPKPTLLLPVSIAMVIGGGLYYMLPRLLPTKFTRDEAGHGKRLLISIAGALIVAYVAYRRLAV